MKHLVTFSFAFNGDQRETYKPLLKSFMDITATSLHGKQVVANAELYLVRYMKKRDVTKVFFRYEQVEVQDFMSMISSEEIPQTVEINESDMIPFKLISYGE